MTDNPVPRVRAGERETLTAFLDYLRECLIGKLDGLDSAQVRQPLVPSGTNLLGLVKHVGAVEVFWLHHVYDALPQDRIPDDALTDDDTPSSVVAFYRDVAATSAAIVAGGDDLDRAAAVVPFGGAAMSLRWVLVHLIEETARHAGHADIIREQLDGRTGR